MIVLSKQSCSYCEDIKAYLREQRIAYKTVDVTSNDTFRDILEIKYGVRYVPVVEIGSSESGIYQAVTEIGLEHLQKALAVSLP
ncbi:glutaredoxin family protein, partial [Lysinibacillus fusiformis]|uniref:glutaredoxin family protein n=1 Tax=Lysinibacillus fusiformis TaxID=28031 RepID=UPI003B970F1A